MDKKITIGRREFIGAGAAALLAGNVRAAPPDGEVKFSDAMSSMLSRWRSSSCWMASATSGSVR